MILACIDSTPGDNEYGPNPKSESGQEEENIVTPPVKSTFKKDW